MPYRPDDELVLMTRAMRWRPALACPRQYMAAWRIGAKVPRRWTRITASKSAMSMLTSALSRRMPALLTSTSNAPNLVIAVRPPSRTRRRCWQRPRRPGRGSRPPLAAPGRSLEHLRPRLRYERLRAAGRRRMEYLRLRLRDERLRAAGGRS